MTSQHVLRIVNFSPLTFTAESLRTHCHVLGHQIHY